MYTAFFKLNELPFRLAPDPRFHFLAASHESARARLRNGLHDTDGCLLLMGDAGTGKTSLALDLLQELPDSHVLVHVRNPDMSVTEFYQTLLGQLDERPAPSARSALLAGIDTCLARAAAMRRTVILFVDNGERASFDLLDEILRLARRSGGGARNLRLLMAARPSIARTLEQLRGRGRSDYLSVTTYIGAFDQQETIQYVDHRVGVAANPEVRLFDATAAFEVFRFTGGVPRLINTLADASLVHAFDRGRERVDAMDVRAAADKLQWVEFSARSVDPVVTGSNQLIRPDAQEATASAGHLCIELSGNILAEFDLPIGKVTLGRAKNNDVRIESTYISRHHCHILTTPLYSVIEDLQSQNGILVGRRKVSVHRLQHGDRVCVGEHVLVFSRTGKAVMEQAPIFPLTLFSRPGETDVLQTRLMIKQAPVDIR